MCRFVFYRGPEMSLDMLTTLPRNSLIHQSYQAEMREEPLNGDGFGIAWYAPTYGPEPAVFRSIQPAWNDLNLRNIARVTESSTVLAHVRAATPGLPVMQTNCHPFTAGALAFCHNGYIPEFSRIKRALRQTLTDETYAAIAGSTDSEHIFALIVDALPDGTSWTLNELQDAMASAVRTVLRLCRESGISEACQLNLALTDGRQALMTRYTDGDPNACNTLFVHAGRQYTCVDGICHMIDPDESDGSVLVASEPLSDDDGWEAVAVGGCVRVHSNHQVQMGTLFNATDVAANAN